VSTAVSDYAVIGEPIAYAIGFLVLVLVAFVDDVGALITVVHEGGHMLVAALTGRGHRGFILNDEGGGSTEIIDPGFGVGDYLVTFAGYATPPLFGLGGAYLILHDNAWAVLWVGILLLVLALLFARNALATVVTLLAVVGVGWVAWEGSPKLQAAVAVGLVWLLLLGGLRSTLYLSRAERSDPWWLARRTLIPTPVWQGIWVAIAVVSVWVGGRVLLDL
jgi:hypothetical protein